MKKYIINKSINALLFIIFAFVVECISFAFMHGTPFASYVFLDLLIFLLLATPILFIKTNKFDVIYFSILLFVLVILLIVNTNYYLVLGDIFSLQYLSYVGEGFSVINAGFINFPHIIILFSSLILFVLLLIYINLKVIKQEKISGKNKLFSAIGGVILLVLSTVGYSISLNAVLDHERNDKNNYLLDLITLSKADNFHTLGMLSYYTKEFDYLFVSSDASHSEVKAIGEFLQKRVDTNSSYTGLLKDYNVVTIMIETGTKYMINETLTPNLYSMCYDGIDFSNNYCKNKTNVSEYLGIVGNYPTSGLTGDKTRYKLPFSLPAVLNDYNTMYFHDVGSNRDIYSRKKLMPVLGFDNSYFHEDLLPGVEEWHWGGNYTLDSVTVEPVIDYMLQDISKPLYAFYTSLSMHGPYVNPSNRLKLSNLYLSRINEAQNSGKWINPLKGTVNESCMVNYMMACMDFDVALGKMIEAFKEKGIFDKTLFVLYGDHDLYYDGADDQQLSYSLTGTNDIRNYELYDTVLLFYNKKLNEYYYNKNQNSTMEQFTSPNVIVPTILDLLGKEYNANIYMADSIFSNRYSEQQIYYSYELSCFFNNNYLTSDGLTIEKVFDENSNNSDEFMEKVSDYVIKQSFIDKIYQSNLFDEYEYSDFCY